MKIRDSNFDYSNIADRSRYDKLNEKFYWFHNKTCNLFFSTYHSLRPLVISSLLEFVQNCPDQDRVENVLKSMDVSLDQFDSGKVEIGFFVDHELIPAAEWLAQKPRQSLGFFLHPQFQCPIADVMHSFCIDPHDVMENVLPHYRGYPGAWTDNIYLKNIFQKLSFDEQNSYARELWLWFENNVQFDLKHGKAPAKEDLSSLAVLTKYRKYEMRYVLVERAKEEIQTLSVDLIVVNNRKKSIEFNTQRIFNLYTENLINPIKTSPAEPLKEYLQKLSEQDPVIFELDRYSSHRLHEGIHLKNLSTILTMYEDSFRLEADLKSKVAINEVMNLAKKTQDQIELCLSQLW